MCLSVKFVFENCVIAIATLLLTVLFSLTGAVNAEDFYVSPQGDDDNPGTSSEPFGTVGAGCLALSPGDTLFIHPGVYRDEGTIFVRFVQPDTFEFLPLVGSKSETTCIVGLGHRGCRPVIQGNMDVRGSHIRITGLDLRGNENILEPGIGVYESHNITIGRCRIYGFGGGGIAFNQCDIVHAYGNTVGFNAFTNPNQSSGISLYQSVVRTESDCYYGAIISCNISVGNENRVPPTSGGKISDGNGIIVDDFLYTQDTGIVAEAVSGLIDTGLATGVPVIEFDENGLPLSYPRKTLINGNTTLFNGGRGIHVFLADNVDIVSNHSFYNLRSADLTEGLPRDEETDDPFFVYGEINLTDSKYVWVGWNCAATDQEDAAAGAEQFFDRVSEDSSSPNYWKRNWLRNFVNKDRDVDVFGVDFSSLLRQGRTSR